MAYGDTFFAFIRSRKIGASLLIDGKFETILTEEEVLWLVKNNCLADARNGGLVIGDFHVNGGVHMLLEHGNSYKYAAEMEGYEFIVNYPATRENFGLLKLLNENIITDHTIPPNPFAIPSDIRLIDLMNLSFQIILVDAKGQYIINRESTRVNLELLNGLNEGGIV